MHDAVQRDALHPQKPNLERDTGNRPISLSLNGEAAALRMFQLNWRLLAAVGGIVVAGLVATEFYVRPACYLVIFALSGTLWWAGQRIKKVEPATRSRTQLAYCLVALAQIFVAVSILTTLTYLATSTGQPLRDKTLLAWDLALGFDFRSYLQFFNNHPQFLPMLATAYTSIGWQLAAMGVILPLTANGQRSAEAICSFTLALLATTFISAWAPAIGVYDTLGLQPSDFPYFQPQGYYDTARDVPLLRAGGLHGLILSHLVGVLTFPSFHAASAALYIWAFWPLTVARPLIVFWNLAMIVATPLGGGHYLVDILAGILVAVLAILTTLVMGRAIRPSPAPSGDA